MIAEKILMVVGALAVGAGVSIGVCRLIWAWGRMRRETERTPEFREYVIVLRRDLDDLKAEVRRYRDVPSMDQHAALNVLVGELMKQVAALEARLPPQRTRKK